MFGYIHATKEQLGDEYERFCSYYCGLCKTMGKNCSFMSRLGLSYDITFMAILLSGVCETDEDDCMETCIVHPVRKMPCIKNSDILKYCADMSVILTYEKCLDDWKDDKSLKSLAGMIIQHRAYKRCFKRHTEIAGYIKNKLIDLRKLEKSKCTEIDVIADKFASILAKLFTPEFVKEENLRRQLEWMGYNIGRWIYILDAVNDIKDDYKKGTYNPFVINEVEDIDSYTKQLATKEEYSLTFNLENIAAVFDLMNLCKNYELLKKIIYISLPQKQAGILKTAGGNDGSV